MINSNAIVNITRRLNGKRHMSATLYSAMYGRKHEVTNNIAFD